MGVEENKPANMTAATADLANGEPSATSLDEIIRYQKDCIVNPIVSCAVFGGACTAMKAVQGTGAAITSPRLLLPIFATYAGTLYVFNVLQCPMASISGGERLYHPPIAASIIGYLGVHLGKMSVPFVGPNFFQANPNIKPPVAGALMYGGMMAVFQVVVGVISQ
jgi:hypothetical protein